MMSKLFNIVDSAMDGRRPWKEDALWVSLWCLGVYALVLALRLSLWTVWDHDLMRVGNEFLMSTHDSYLWLAKARNVTFWEPQHLAWLTKILHEIFGFSLGSIGFWGPAFMASLVAPVCFLWGWIAAGRTGGIIAGLLGAMGLGFYQRSKLGYYDTDMFTLLMPMATGALLAWWVGGYIRRTWLPKRDDTETMRPPMTLINVFLVGLFIRMASWWHQDLAFLNALLVVGAGGMILLLGHRETRLRAMLEWTAILLIALPGMGFNTLFLSISYFISFSAKSNALMGIALGLLILTALHRNMVPNSLKQLGSNAWFSWAIFLVVLLILTNVLTIPLSYLLSKAGVYTGPTAASTGNSDAAGIIHFPSVVSSIVEAARIEWNTVLTKMSLYSWMTVTSIICAAVVILFRPEMSLLFPMLLIGIMSLKLGSRFAMFGCGATAVFFGIAVNTVGNALLPQGTLRLRLQTVIQTVVAIALLVPAYMSYKDMPPTPVLTRPHAEALMGLKGRIPEDANIWTWWDWGYATWYFSGIHPSIDGGRHSGKDIFPTAYALSTDSPQQANQMLFYTASKQYEPFSNMSGMEAMDTIKSFANSNSSFGVKDKQYFVVCWQNYRLLKWISHFGNWNLATGTTRQFNLIESHPSEIAYNLDYGIIANPMGQQSAMKSIDILGPEMVNDNYYPMNVHSPRLLTKTPHLVINGLMGQPFLFDNDGYNSMLVRLLRDDPEKPAIKKYFRLVAEGLPFVRIYELVQPDQ